MLRFFSVVTFVLLSVFSASGAERIALVIGNAHYRNFPGLKNPLNDADSMAKALTRLNFDVTFVKDRSYAEMNQDLLDFYNKTANSKMAIVYYAGHAVEFGGKNYLIPVDAAAHSNDRLEGQAIAMQELLETLKRPQTLKLVFLDACRDNPLSGLDDVAAGSPKSVTRGLAIEAPPEVLVSYSAAAGKSALDGIGDHSPYTAALLKYIETPDLELASLFRKVGEDVHQVTNGQQTPIEYGRLPVGEIYLNHKDAVPISELEGELTKAARREWQIAKLSNDAATLEEFTARYPGNPLYLALAKERLAEIRSQNRQSAGRVALVIGVDNYQHAPRLEKPTGDARAVENVLRSWDFDVTVALDSDKATILRTLADFREKARTADTAVVFFSGHGIEVNGNDYLVLADAELNSFEDVRSASISATDLIGVTDGAKRLRVVMIDAPRNNPFSAGSDAPAAKADPLADAVSMNNHLLLSYSAAPGGVAMDGQGKHSPYVEAFIAASRREGADIRDVFGAVERDIALAGEQQKATTLFSLPADVTPLVAR